MNHLERIKDKKIENICFISEGGLGKVIASTAVVKRLKEEFPDKKFIVVAGYPDVFMYNPNVHKVFNFGNPLYFYDDYITPKSYVLKLEPYVDNSYWAEGKHLIDVWCEQIGIERKGAMPEMFFLDNEIEAGRLYVEKLTNKNTKKFVLFQWVGGINPNEKTDMAYQDALSRMHRRSFPKNVAQKIANKLVARNFVVGCPQTDNFPVLEGTEKINYPIRSVIILLKFSEGFIGIDSFLHHAGACLGAKGIVAWGGTNPKRLGYDIQTNMQKDACPTPMCHRPDSYMFDSNNVNGMWNCPHNAKCMQFDADEIINAYEALEIAKKVVKEAEAIKKE